MLRKSASPERLHLLIVGGFPPPESNVFGGVVTECKLLLQSSLPDRAELSLVDTTQISNPPPGFVVRLLLALRRCLVYLRRLERQRPDAVLLFTASGASVLEKGAMAWYARLRGIPAVMLPRGSPVVGVGRRPWLERACVRLAFAGARKVLCQGDAWRKFAVEVLGFSPEDAPVVPNWTATPALLAIGRNRCFDPGTKPLRLLFMGWLEQKKGVFELIEACRQLAESREFVLDIAGEGNASAAARELVGRHGLADIVRFRGWLQRADVERALAEADALVLPSWGEGLPNAMIEAMSAKLPVVVTAVGNIPDAVTDGCDALLIQPRDVPALRDALAKLIDEPELRRRLGNGAFSTAEAQWGVERAVEDILSIARACLRRPCAG